MSPGRIDVRGVDVNGPKTGWGYHSCACTLKGITQSCDKDSFKANLAKKIKTIQCESKYLNRFERELGEKRKPPAGYERWELESRDAIRHEYKKGTLKTFIDPDMSNCGQYTSRYLLQKLKL